MANLNDVEANAGTDKVILVQNDANQPSTINERPRIRFPDDAINFGPPLHRSNTTYSIHSIQSTKSISRSIDPKLAIPIRYRTLSYNIEDSQRKQKAKQGKTKKDKLLEDPTDAHWHVISQDDICKMLTTDATFGISNDQVKVAQSQYGRNVPSPPPSRLLQKTSWYFFGGFGSILLGGGILVFISWKPLGNPPAVANLALAIVLVFVFLFQAVFNAWQDFSSSRVMKSITGMLPEDCTVIRSGQQQTIQASEIFPGDLLLFKAGSKLPADVRMTEVSSDLKFDRSILTGESVPLAAVVDFTDNNYLETRNIGFAGTHCTAGSGSGIVIATGDNTVFGHIAKLTSRDTTGRTPLQNEIRRFVFLIISLMVFMNIVIVGVWAGYIRKYHPDYMPVASLIVNLVSVAIAFVPE